MLLFIVAYLMPRKTLRLKVLMEKGCTGKGNPKVQVQGVEALESGCTAL